MVQKQTETIEGIEGGAHRATTADVAWEQERGVPKEMAERERARRAKSLFAPPTPVDDAINEIIDCVPRNKTKDDREGDAIILHFCSFCHPPSIIPSRSAASTSSLSPRSLSRSSPLARLCHSLPPIPLLHASSQMGSALLEDPIAASASPTPRHTVSDRTYPHPSSGLALSWLARQPTLGQRS